MNDLHPKSVLKKTRNKLFGDLKNTTDQLLALQQEQQKQSQELLALSKKIDQAVQSSKTIQLSSEEILTKIFSGAKMYLDPRDAGLVPHLVLDGDWERNITQAWLKVVKSGDVVFDIGANYGYFSVLAAQQSTRDCKIISFEANPQIIPYITKTMHVNSFDSCSTIENVAVSSSEGKLTLHILKDFIASSSIHGVEHLREYSHAPSELEEAIAVEVPATSIDAYCAKNNIKQVDLIKMDIEGYEDEAYAGMRKVIQASPNATLFIEFTSKSYKHPKDFYKQMLNDFGNVYLIDEEGNLHKQSETSYEVVIDNSSDWIMPVFSKNKNLGAS